MKFRLTVLSFLQLAAWGAYLTSMGRYLGTAGMGEHIGIFYAMLGIVSIFMPALIGIVADRWIPAQKTLAISHFIAGGAMLALGYLGQLTDGVSMISYPVFLSIFALSVGFYMPTIGLSNAVSYNAIDQAGMDKIKDFPPIRVWGTVGFIVFMWITDFAGFQGSSMQFVLSGLVSILVGFYSFTLPNCPICKKEGKQSIAKMLGLDAFKLFKERRMAMFFIFSMFLGVSLQITNGYANPFISSFAAVEEYANTFGVQHSNILISLSQISEALCILLIPFVLGKFGIKKVMLMSMGAWVLRFGFFGIGNPGTGVVFFILSMLIYGMAFDFFNVSGSLFVDEEVDSSMRSSAQGLFMLMTNGLGATVGMIAAQEVVNHFCHWENGLQVGDWTSVWYIFAAYAFVVMIGFALLFHPDKKKG